MEPKASGMMSLGIPFQFTRFSAAFAARSVQVGEDCLPVGLERGHGGGSLVFMEAMLKIGADIMRPAFPCLMEQFTS